MAARVGGQDAGRASAGPRPGEAPLDAWSLVHAASGAGLALVVGPWYVALGLLVAYEGLEAGLRRIKVEEGGLFEYESWPNIVADVAVGMLGFAVLRASWAWHWL